MDDSDRLTPPVRVFVLDDHELLRRGLVELLSGKPDLEVVGEASSVQEALRRIPACRPDVAVLDVRLPDGTGIEVCREIRASMPDLACLMLTSYDDEQAFGAAVLAGAAGYLLKEIRGLALVNAIRSVAGGLTLIDPAMTAKLVHDLSSPSAPGPSERLTPRQLEVLDLIADGMTNRQIAQALHLSEKTVKNNVSALLERLGMQRRTQAAVYRTQVRAGRR